MYHDPHEIFKKPIDPSDARTSSLIVLNQPILCQQAFRQCYEACEWKIYADGGANRVLALENKQGNDNTYVRTTPTE